MEVLHTPGHTEGSVCLQSTEDRILFTGDTLFAGGWGRVDLPGASQEQMIASLSRLASLDPGLTVLAGHGPQTTIERELPWLALVAERQRLPF
jgi:glyoxylase-like metal-dependent hydrolase (beta-lactamase superfamily II)